MELCAWHSKKWVEARYNEKRQPELRKYINEVFGPALRRALRGSEHKLILCVGSEYPKEVFSLIWPEIMKKEIPIPIDGWPHPVKSNAREFHVYEIPGEGHIITTSARGSNRIPSASAFGEIEKEIIKQINKDQNNKNNE